MKRRRFEISFLVITLLPLQFIAVLANGDAATRPTSIPSTDAASCARDAQVAGRYNEAADCEEKALSQLRSVGPGLDRYALYVNYLGLAYDLLMLGKTSQATSSFNEGIKYQPRNNMQESTQLFVGDVKTSLTRLENVLDSSSGLTEVPLAYVDSGQARQAHDSIAIWLSGRSDEGLRRLHTVLTEAPNFALAKLGFAEMLLARHDQKAACGNFIATAKQREGPSGSVFVGPSFAAMQMLRYCSANNLSAFARSIQM
jgi:tetratricopeptide (TPR) repeat protein